MGRNGAGKSTTLKAIMGLVERTEGQTRFTAKRARSAAVRDRPTGIGLRPGRPAYILRAHGDGESRGGSPAAARPCSGVDSRQTVRLFPNLGEMPHRLGGRMSGGEQQMLTVARTLMGNPDLVLLDEPSEGIAPQNSGRYG